MDSVSIIFSQRRLFSIILVVTIIIDLLKGLNGLCCIKILSIINIYMYPTFITVIKCCAIYGVTYY